MEENVNLLGGQLDFLSGKEGGVGVPKKPQLSNFQDAPKNCGFNTFEKPKNIWAESLALKLTPSISDLFWPGSPEVDQNRPLAENEIHQIDDTYRTCCNLFGIYIPQTQS